MSEKSSKITTMASLAALRWYRELLDDHRNIQRYRIESLRLSDLAGTVINHGVIKLNRLFLAPV
jgi:hypothetical protein